MGNTIGNVLGCDNRLQREQKTVGQVLEEKINRFEEELNRLKTLRDCLKGTPAYDLIESTYYL